MDQGAVVHLEVEARLSDLPATSGTSRICSEPADGFCTKTHHVCFFGSFGDRVSTFGEVSEQLGQETPPKCLLRFKGRAQQVVGAESRNNTFTPS